MNKRELMYVLKNHVPDHAEEIYTKGGVEWKGDKSPNVVSFLTHDDTWEMPPEWRQLPAYRGGRRFVWVGKIPTRTAASLPHEVEARRNLRKKRKAEREQPGFVYELDRLLGDGESK